MVSGGGGCSAVHYQWNDGVLSQNRSNLYAGTYTVTVFNSCQTITTNFVVSEPATGLLLTGTSKNPKCSGGTNGTATVAVSGGGGSYSYIWSAGGQITPTATGLAAGVYIVTVTDQNNGCTRSMVFTLVNPPVLTVALTVVNPTMALPLSGQIAAVATGGTPNYVYLWSNSKTTATVTGLSANTYTVKVTDKNGCTVTASATLVTEGGPRLINPNDQPSVTVSVLPNPSDGLFNIKVIAFDQTTAWLELMDLTGRVVITEEMPLIAGNNSMMLDAQAYPKGIYMLRFTASHKTQTIRLIIQ
jgi:hypothetical protein